MVARRASKNKKVRVGADILFFTAEAKRRTRKFVVCGGDPTDSTPPLPKPSPWLCLFHERLWLGQTTETGRKGLVWKMRRDLARRHGCPHFEAFIPTIWI
jgi:hypothetical protein